MIALTTLSAISIAYQLIGTVRDKRRYPPPGKLISLGHHCLHIHSLGAGHPPVVLECGSGDTVLAWMRHAFLSEIAKFTQVCAYDRAGHGWSDPSPYPTSLSQVAEELHSLLTLGAVRGPYILVGHSLGGLHVQYFARRYPAEVAGVVLLDSAHPDLYPHRLAQQSRQRNRLRIIARWLAAHLGILRIARLISSEKPSSKLDELEAVLQLRPSFWNTLRRQNEYLGKEVPAVMKAAGPFPDVPLIVLGGTDTKWLVEFLGSEFAEFWLETQVELAGLSPQGKLIMAEGSGHYIHYDQPELVLEAIREVVGKVGCQ